MHRQSRQIAFLPGQDDFLHGRHVARHRDELAFLPQPADDHLKQFVGAGAESPGQPLAAGGHIAA
jgi:hypothetical protein